MTIDDISNYVKKQKKTKQQNDYKMISSQDNDDETNNMLKSKEEKDEILKITDEIFITDNNTNTNIQHNDDYNNFHGDHDDLLDNNDIEDLKKDVLNNDIY